MKKFLSIILAALMLSMSLASCNSQNTVGTDDNTEMTDTDIDTEGASETGSDTDSESGSTEPEPPPVKNMTFKAGYAREIFTPDFEVRLLGDDHIKLASSAERDICASCIAVRDENGSTVLLYSLDLLYLSADDTVEFKKAVSKETGVPENNIMFNATHTHSAPNPSQDERVEQLCRLACINAAKEAIADLDVCEIYTNTIETEGLNYLRRYADKNGDGIINPADNDYESEIDRRMHVIKFERVDKKDIIFTNFNVHPTAWPTAEGNDNQISPDFIGVVRDKIEKLYKRDAYFSFHQGAAGSSVVKDRVLDKNGNLVFASFIGIERYGDNFAKAVVSALKNMEKMETPRGIKTSESTIELMYDHSQDHLFPIAHSIKSIYDAGYLAAAKELMSAYGFNSMSDVSYIVRKKQAPISNFMTVSAFSIGEIGIGISPYEMALENGAAVKDNSPYKFNVMCAYSNGYFGYIPADFSFDNLGYEVYSCAYKKGTGEQIANEILGLLDQLYK